MDYHLPVYVPGLRCVQSEVTDHIHTSPHLSKSIVMTSLFCISVTGSRYFGGSSAWLVTMIVTFCNKEEVQLPLWQRHNQTFILVTFNLALKNIYLWTVIATQCMLFCLAHISVMTKWLKVSISSIEPCHDLKTEPSTEITSWSEGYKASIQSITWCFLDLLCEEALTMFTSNEYEEESGLFLYNATWILDNQPNFVHSNFLFWKVVWLKIK